MPQGQFPVWLAGQDITAEELAEGLSFISWKEVDLPRSNTVTPTTDADFTLPLLANARYTFTGLLIATGAAISTADLLIKLTWPSGTGGAQGNWMCDSFATTGTTASVSHVRSASGATGAIGVDGSNASGAQISGSLLMGSTQGSLQLLWSQNTSNATATVLKAGSYLQLTRMQ